MKCEILATQVREHVTHLGAAERVHERFAQEGKSFCAAASKELTYKRPHITINNKPVASNTEIVPISDPATAPAPASACSTLATNDPRTDKSTSLTPVISSISTDMSVPFSTPTLAIIQPAIVTASAPTTQTLPPAVTANIQTRKIITPQTDPKPKPVNTKRATSIPRFSNEPETDGYEDNMEIEKESRKRRTRAHSPAPSISKENKCKQRALKIKKPTQYQSS